MGRWEGWLKCRGRKCHPLGRSATSTAKQQLPVSTRHHIPGLVNHPVGAAALRGSFPLGATHRCAVAVKEGGRHCPSACASFLGIEQVEEQEKAISLKGRWTVARGWLPGHSSAQPSFKPHDSSDALRKIAICRNDYRQWRLWFDLAQPQPVRAIRACNNHVSAIRRVMVCYNFAKGRHIDHSDIGEICRCSIKNNGSRR